MDLMKKLRKDEDLLEMLYEFCDVRILSEYDSPQDEQGHLAYNIAGKTFARADTGSEYSLLEDGSVGFWGSEGQGGRMADSLQDFLELIVHCPCWNEFLYEWAYETMDELRTFANEIFEEQQEEAEDDDYDWLEAQQELADCLGIVISDDPATILMRFYHAATREPRFIQTYTEDDGSTHCKTSLFD